MSLLSKLKSVLGLESEREARRGTPAVTVERERGDDEDAPATAGSESAASTGSLVSEQGPGEKVSPAERAEPAEATGAGPEAENETTDLSDVDPREGDADVREDEDESSDGSAEESADEADEADSGESQTSSGIDEEAAASEDLTSVKGVGPAYADRLRRAGVDTIGDLAGADAGSLADEVDLSEKRVGGWVDRASDRIESDE